MGEIGPITQSHVVTDLKVTASLPHSLPNPHTPSSHLLTRMEQGAIDCKSLLSEYCFRVIPTEMTSDCYLGFELHKGFELLVTQILMGSSLFGRTFLSRL